LPFWSASEAGSGRASPASGPIHFPDLALRLGQWRSRLRHARRLSMRQPTGNIIQEAPLAVWANLRQRTLDTAIPDGNRCPSDALAFWRRYSAYVASALFAIQLCHRKRCAPHRGEWLLALANTQNVTRGEFNQIRCQAVLIPRAVASEPSYFRKFNRFRLLRDFGSEGGQ
jgi:hypothetical protein